MICKKFTPEANFKYLAKYIVCIFSELIKMYVSDRNIMVFRSVF